MRYETALTLKCFKARLSAPEEPIACPIVSTARKLDSLFSHVRSCRCACVVATVDDLGTVDRHVRKAYAVLHLGSTTARMKAVTSRSSSMSATRKRPSTSSRR